MLEKMSIVCRWIQNEVSIGDNIVQRQKSFEMKIPRLTGIQTAVNWKV